MRPVPVTGAGKHGDVERMEHTGRRCRVEGFIIIATHNAKVIGGCMKNHSFKFQIGQIVYHRLITPNEYHPDKKPTRTPFLILERIVTECSGGTQLSYNCRLGTISNTVLATVLPERLFSMNEIELEA